MFTATSATSPAMASYQSEDESAPQKVNTRKDVMTQDVHLPMINGCSGEYFYFLHDLKASYEIIGRKIGMMGTDLTWQRSVISNINSERS